MKRLFTLFTIITLTISVVAQSPQKMSYQAVIRNSSDQLVTKHAIGMRISILQGSEIGTPIYVETQIPNTNANGLVTIEIGGGTPVTGLLAGIDWSTGTYFIKTETDPTGGTSYTITGVSQILSVPYALYSKTAETADYNYLTNKPALFDGAWTSLTGKPLFATIATSGSYNDLINKPTLFSGNYNDLTNKPILFSGAWTDITGKPVFATIATSGSYSDLLNRPALFDGTWVSLSGKPTFATIATSGTFDDLLSKPTTLAGYSITDAMSISHPTNGITTTNILNWNTAYGWGNHAGLYKLNSYIPTWVEITDKPTFAAVATSGSYNDLLNKPELFDGSWTSLTGKPSFAPVATTGSYNDLTNKPTLLNSQWTTSGSNIYYLGNAAIGTTLPRYKLTIYDDNNSFLGFYNSTTGTSGSDGFMIGTESGGPVWIWNRENSNIHFGTNNLHRMIINANGQVDILNNLNLHSTGAIGGALYVNNSQALWWDGTYFSWGYDGTYNYFADKVTIGNAANPGYMLYVQGNAWSTGTWGSSDARFKKNILAIDNSLDKLMKIRGTSFEFRIDEFKDYQFAEGPQFGFIAQELENVFPEVVKTDSNGYKSINYNGMIPVLLEAVKEQQAIIEKMENKIKDLTNLVNSLITNQSSLASK